MDKPENINIVQVDVASLKPAEYNPRQASEKEYNDLKNSLKSFGFVTPIVVNSAPDRLNTVIGGHFRLKVAKDLGYTQVPIVYVSIPDIEKERELNLRLNKNLGSWDFVLLANFDEELLKNVGFESDDLSKIFQTDIEEDIDDAPEVRQTDIKLGDIFILGNHRLMCGDATKQEDIDKLMAEQKADMVFTDPPYMISNEVKITRGRNKMKFKGPDITHNFGNWDKFASLDDFLCWTFKWVDEVIKVFRNGGMFCSYFDRDKVNLLSRYLQDKYNFKCKGYYADCKLNPVPQARKVKWMNGWEIVGLWQSPAGNLIYNYQLGQQKDWEPRSIVGGKERTEHPTQKPLSVIMLFIKYWSNEENIILDLFGGSGSTLIACERLNRKCFMMEMDPQYCQVIIDRWEKYANQKAVKV